MLSRSSLMLSSICSRLYSTGYFISWLLSFSFYGYFFRICTLGMRFGSSSFLIDAWTIYFSILLASLFYFVIYTLTTTGSTSNSSVFPFEPPFDCYFDVSSLLTVLTVLIRFSARFLIFSFSCRTSSYLTACTGIFFELFLLCYNWITS